MCVDCGKRIIKRKLSGISSYMRREGSSLYVNSVRKNIAAILTRKVTSWSTSLLCFIVWSASHISVQIWPCNALVEETLFRRYCWLNKYHNKGFYECFNSVEDLLYEDPSHYRIFWPPPPSPLQNRTKLKYILFLHKKG